MQQIWCDQILNISLLLKLIQENTKLYTLSGYASYHLFLTELQASQKMLIIYIYLSLLFQTTLDLR